MHLYLMRHGIAASASRGQSDAERSLTDEGMNLVRLQARAFAQAGFRIDRLFHSPLLRARQTASLVAPALGITPEQEVLLQPGCSLNDLAELVRGHSKANHVMVVGHQPDLGLLVRALTGSNVAMHTGTLAVVETAVIRPLQGMLLGLYNPQVMGRLGARV